MEGSVKPEGVGYRRQADPAAPPKSDNLGMLVSWFEDSEEATREGRKESERDRDYYDGKQLTEKEIQTLRQRGQPDVINNEIQRKVDFLTGFEATQRTDPKAFPRNPQDQDAAEAATDMLRYQEQASNLDQSFSDIWENMLIEGYGGAEVLGPSKANPNVIEVIVWSWDRLFYDPHSRKHDFSDALYFGGVLWMDAETAVATWPQAKQAVESTVAQEPVNSETYDDRPHVQWATKGRRNRIRVVQMYYRDGANWHWCLFTKAGKIDGGSVEFLDENGDIDCPMILQSAYVDRENNRYGAVRQMIGPQDEINHRSSKALHLLTMNGVITEEGVITDVDKFKREMARADGVAVVNAGGLDRLKLRDKIGEATGNLQLLQEAKQAIQMKGPNAALAGKQGQEASGRAIRASQEGGITEMARLRDRHTHFKRRVYRAIWNRCRQFLTEETWIRVTDDEQKLRFVGFNRAVTFGEAAAKELQGQGVPPEQVEPVVMQHAQQLGIDPRMPVGQENVLADMDMDIIIENATESINIQEEQFAKLVELAGSGIKLPPEVYIEASSLRNKEKLLEMVKVPPEQQQAQAKMTMKAAHAETEKTISETLKNRAQAMKYASEADAKVAEAMAPEPPPEPMPSDGGEPLSQGPASPAGPFV